MTAQAERIVALARGWIGTPYRHQAACRGAGCDCLGLIRGLWRELRGAEPECPPAYSMDWSEPARQELLWQAAARHLAPKPLADEAPGDVILMRMRAGAVAKHLGVMARVGANATFIHAYSGHSVVETALSLPWRRRVVARFAFPEKG